MSIVSAYSVLSMFEDILSNEEIKIKWPNDVLVNGKKISGTLIENVIHGNMVKSVVGIGININSRHKSTNNFYLSISKFDRTYRKRI